MRLHIGGHEVKAGWELLDIAAADGVDFVGDIADLSRFANGSCEQIYASHVLEHVPQAALLPTLVGLHRVLEPGGQALISVPDLEVLCRLFLDPALDLAARWHVMRMMFGGQMDRYDFHFIGLTAEFLSEALHRAGFTRIERVEDFGLFDDTSALIAYGVRISLNVIATR